MEITKFGQEIINSAKYYLDKGCKEQGKNIVYCAGDLTQFNEIKQGMAYCAAFVSQVIKDTLLRLGYKLNFTLNSNAVDTLFKQANNNILINSIPKPGSIAILKTGISTNKKTKDGNNYSHAMIVWDVTSDYQHFITIEGNTSSLGVEGVFSIYRPSPTFSINDYKFLHIQDYFDNLQYLVENNSKLNNNVEIPNLLATNNLYVRNEYR